MKTWLMICSGVIALLVILASLLGLLNPDTYLKETANWATQAAGQDIGNLLAVPVMLIGGYWYGRGSKKGFAVWVGSLFYLLYAYIIYAFAVHFNALFLVYVAILGLTAYALIGAFMEDISPLKNTKNAKMAAWSVLVIGVLFALLWLKELLPALKEGVVPTSLEETGLWVNPVHVIDLAVLLPAMMTAGWSALRGGQKGSGFVTPLLVFSVLMGSSIVATMIMMAQQGYQGTTEPMIMVGGVVAVSLIAIYKNFKLVK